METVGAAVGILAVLPQCVQTAKMLDTLRTRFDEAPMLITSLYSESLVVAASLSQIQSLLQHGALQNRPELYEPFDRALTGCKIVYSCLEKSVRELAEKAHNGNLSTRDRLKYLWKEEDFKEILQQIRGQQIGLGLLVQGLQMESMADIKQLLHDNNPKLEEATCGSRDLRLSHPDVKVPGSIYDLHADSQSLSDAQSVLSSAEFTFDDEVINSKAYRRVMAQAALRSERSFPTLGVIEGDLIDLTTPVTRDLEKDTPSGAALELQSLSLEGAGTPNQETDLISSGSKPRDDVTDGHADLLQSLEQNLLPFMPPSSAGFSTTGIEDDSLVEDELSQALANETEQTEGEQETRNAMVLAEDKVRLGSASPAPIETTQSDEKPPPLPPRRPNAAPEPSSLGGRSSFEDTNSNLSTPSMLSKVSTLSSQAPSYKSTKRKALAGKHEENQPLQHTTSFDMFESLSFNADDLVRVATVEDVEMHNIWVHVIGEEERFIERVDKFREGFYDAAIKKWPVLEKHLEAIVLSEQLASQHRQYLLDPLRGQIAQKSFATCNPAIFEAWVTKTHKLYRNWAQRMPHSENAIRTTQSTYSNFAPFLGSIGLGDWWFGKSWLDYLYLPLSQLDIYLERLSKLLELAQRIGNASAKKDKHSLKRALEVVQRLKQSCIGHMNASRKREEVQSLDRRIQTLDASYLSRLFLSEQGRNVRYQGGMAIRVKGTGTWQGVHVVILDNYLFWASLKPPKTWKVSRPTSVHGGHLWVLDEPIPLNDLEVLPTDQNRQFTKATMLDDIPTGTVLYYIFVKSKSSEVKSHKLGAWSPKERDIWLKHLEAAVTVHEVDNA
ncbi:hypothetical protein BDV96DRAFT_649303 [Lophiotrema nucula]|uniref:PH domain-containing protein n=1 Tax=Lophiotrema nucula TaxID=690887 RepID=A0A6A5YXP2_9PLEO|nr:hypothetical protein BDV96DRAFT_649303 [Lophiotrema nucula]